MCYLTRPYITFLVRKRSLQSIFLLTSQNTSLFNTMFILFSWVLLAWRKTAISVIFFFWAPVDLKPAQDFSEVCVKISFVPTAGRQDLGLRAAASRGASMQPLQCIPVLLPPIPSPAAGAALSLARLRTAVDQLGNRDVALLSFPTPSNPFLCSCQLHSCLQPVLLCLNSACIYLQS